MVDPHQPNARILRGQRRQDRVRLRRASRVYQHHLQVQTSRVGQYAGHAAADGCLLIIRLDHDHNRQPAAIRLMRSVGHAG